ncbi:MAG: hypothetical protein NW206_07220 [Hyphomonadaceae bacterium]|nr:hypothetical protein [Hyphomonadaceae bacterium]
MPRVSFAFFIAASFCGLAGMAWGGYMGASQDFTWHDAHAHLNLVGWTTLSLMGGFYALAGAARPKIVSWINFLLSTSGVLIFVPGLAMLAAGIDYALAFVVPGSLLALSGMAVFVWAVFVTMARTSPPAAE